MIALDTNILARFFLNDSESQAQIAEALLHGNTPCTAPMTVFLELVWVLGSLDCSRGEIAHALRLLCGPNFKLSDPDTFAFALHWYEAGMDFGDAIHLAMSSHEQTFHTFDKAFAKNAAKLGAFPEVVLPSALQSN